MNTQMNKFQNIYKSKNKENSKISTNKQIGSSAYSKNKKTLEKMLREYQTFCKKYFGESTPIGSMTEERMNKLLEDENNIKEKYIYEHKQHFIETLEDNQESFSNFIMEEQCDKLPCEINYNENDILGNHKNNKNDYKQRNKLIFQSKKKEEEIKKDKIVENEDEYNDFEQKENFEEIKNEKAKIIQNVFRKKKHEKKERIYLGYDKNKLYILKIYIEKLDTFGNVISINVNYYSMKKKINNSIKIDITNLLKKEIVSREELSQNIEEIIEKIISHILEINNEEDNIMKEDRDEDEEEYTF